MVEPTAAVMNQAGPDGCGAEYLQCGFGGCLGIAKLGIRAAGSTEKGQLIMLGHLSQRTDHQAQFRSAVRKNRRLHVHDGCKGAVNKSGTGPGGLSQDQSTQGFGTALNHRSGKGRRG